MSFVEIFCVLQNSSFIYFARFKVMQAPEFNMKYHILHDFRTSNHDGKFDPKTQRIARICVWCIYNQFFCQEQGASARQK